MTVTNKATPVPLDSANSRLHRKQLAAALNRASEHNSKISVQVDKNTASITTEQTVRASADSALASTLTALTATVNSNNSTLTAAISTEQTARANADTAFATSVTNLSATVTSNNSTLTAAVSTEATARASADGSIMADYSIQVSTLANGKKALAGLKLIAGANQATEIDVIANKFNVYQDVAGVTQGGPVFSIVGGAVTITGALYAGSITTDQLTVGSTLITGSLLASNTVDTTNITNNAVTLPFAKVWASPQSITTGGTTIWSQGFTAKSTTSSVLITLALTIWWSGGVEPTVSIVVDGGTPIAVVWDDSVTVTFSGGFAGASVINVPIIVTASGATAHTVVVKATSSGTPSQVNTGSSATMLVCQR